MGIFNLPGLDGSSLPPELQQAAQAFSQRQSGAMPPIDLQPADVLPPTAHPSFLRRVIGNAAAMGGADPAEVSQLKDPTLRDRVAAYKAKQAAALFPGDRMAQTLWVNGDEDFRKAVAGRFADQKTGAGEEIVRNGKTVHRNPKVDSAVVNDQVAATVDGKTTFSTRALPSHETDETARNHRAAEATAQTVADTGAAKADADALQGVDKQVLGEALRKFAAKETTSDGENKIINAWIAHQMNSRPQEDPLTGGVPVTPRAATPARPAAAAPATARPRAPKGLAPDATVVSKGRIWKNQGGYMVDQGAAAVR